MVVRREVMRLLDGSEREGICTNFDFMIVHD